MTLDKAIKHGKEHREEYRGSRRFDRSCRNHGDCGYCSGNRQVSKMKLEEVDKLIEDWEEDLAVETKPLEQA